MRNNGMDKITSPDIRSLGGNQFVQISVRNARTHLNDGKAQFTDFEIELKTNHIAFTLKSSKVRRRYSDFVWLRNRLSKDTIDSNSLPSLPGRRLFGRFNKDFIKQRQKKLQEFLFGLAQNNVYLSHAAIHLFLQSKLSVEEIDSYLDNNQEEDASETILAESEGKARLNGYEARDLTTDGLSDPGDLEDAIDNNNSYTESLGSIPVADKEVLSDTNDGNNADDELDDAAPQDDAESENNEGNVSDDEETLVEELNKLRMSLPAPLIATSSDTDRFGSSFEYSDDDQSPLESSGESEGDSSSIDRRSLRSNPPLARNSQTPSRVNSHDNIRSPSRKSKKRYSSRTSSFRKLYNSNASLPEFYNPSYGDGVAADERERSLRRSKSVYETRTKRRNRYKSEILYTDVSTSDTSKWKTHQRHHSLNRTPSSRKVRRSTSFASSIDRTPVRRKISLNEYIIVGRESLVDLRTNETSRGGDEDFNKSSL
ncbi:uncharacterized protein [Clytia hemisphaerica]|uniref:PX domain-containing protein n=1 Tax=Clytia hemisphaerica TaxID=252671 RepID=A0A7M5V727_9CNID